MDGGLGFVVTAIENPGKVYWPSAVLGEDDSSGQWFIVHVIVQNITDEVQTFDACEQILLEQTLPEEETLELEVDDSTHNGTDLVEIEPGAQINAVLMFDVHPDFPVNGSGVLLELNSTYHSVGVEVHLY